ncbi:MAG: 4Fe-4S binding protein [Fibrobacterales bacterium]
MSYVTSYVKTRSGAQIAAIVMIYIGLIALALSLIGYGSSHSLLVLLLVVMPLVVGTIGHSAATYLTRHKGVMNNGTMFSGVTNRGVPAWVLGVVITLFYVLWYWWPHTLVHLYRMSDPISQWLRGKPSDQWYFYGLFYTIAVVVMGTRALIRYRHSRYQIVRTAVVMAAQFFLAFLIPSLLVYFKQPEKYLNYSWPLSYSDFFPTNFIGLMNNPAKLSLVLLVWGVAFTFVLTPILTYLYGKRWYCSWVCGCGGLANTAGDTWRHLSSSTKRAWSIEKVSIYSVLGLIVFATGALWFSFATGWVTGFSKGLAEFYGFFIGSVLSGVIGVGLYPLLGTRIWCRFGCPMAGILGILQRVNSRFRITTNGAQCVSCGNCSTYCEMGIDVREYAQRGENIIRASCVGCGMCSLACPRGVLNLENGPKEGRYNRSISLADEVKSGTVVEVDT